MPRMRLHLSLPRFRRRPPRPAPVDTRADDRASGLAGGWHLSSFELRQGLDVVELDGSFAAGLEAPAAPEGAASQA